MNALQKMLLLRSAVTAIQTAQDEISAMAAECQSCMDSGKISNFESRQIKTHLMNSRVLFSETAETLEDI